MNENNIRKKYKLLTHMLIEKGLSITTMESITSGQIASLITDTEGASAVLKGAFITYSNEAKIQQGVPEDIIKKYGVYSKETAREMALACMRVYNADIAVGITGTTGNVDINNADSIPGQVYYAIAADSIIIDGFFEMKKLSSRLEYKLYAADVVADEIIKIIKNRCCD